MNDLPYPEDRYYTGAAVDGWLVLDRLSPDADPVALFYGAKGRVRAAVHADCLNQEAARFAEASVHQCRGAA